MDFDNVYVFVADALRWDSTPERVSNLGVTLKTVAHDLMTASSFSTLFTGLYPPQHGVGMWAEALESDIPTIFDLEGVNTSIYTYTDAIHTVIDWDNPRADTLETIEPPFFHIRHTGMPHLVYDNDSELSSTEYLTQHQDDLQKIRNDYQAGINDSVELFFEELDILRERGLMEDTLVIFTSDHGEVLGEWGEYAHSAPACPELVYVPTILLHPELDEDSLNVDPQTEIVEHVDIIETALSSIGVSDQLETMGTDITSYNRERSWGYNHANRSKFGRSVYRSDSIWWRDGGFVFQNNWTPLRLLYMIRNLWQRPIYRHNKGRLLTTYLKNVHTYGFPEESRSRGLELLEELKSELEHRDARHVDLDGEIEDHLEDLGYRT